MTDTARRPPHTLAERRQTAAPLRVPPHSPTAEQALLGAMLLAPAAIDAATLVVTAEDFYSPANGHLYAAIVDLYDRDQAADPVTVADHLASQGLLDTVGGIPGLLALQADTPATSNAGRYAQIVADKALLRRLIGAAGELAELGYEAGDEVDGVLDEAERRVLALGTGRAEDFNTYSYGEVVDEHMERLAEICEHGAPPGLRTGWADLDNRLAPLRPGNCVIVAARPSTGKTAFALNLACHVALAQDQPIFFASMEMSHQELLDRIFAAQARVPLAHITEGAVRPHEWRELDDARRRIKNSRNLYFDDTGSPTMLQVAAKGRRVRAARGALGMVILDYAELVGERRDETEALRVGQIARGAKRLAKELDCVVVLLSQVKRAVEERLDKRPTLGDLAASGGLEAAADVVLVLYRDELYDSSSKDVGVAEVLIRKARQGATGTVKLAYLGEIVLFTNLTTQSYG